MQTLRGVLPQTEIFSAPQPLASADDRAESVSQLGRVQLRGDRQLGILEPRVGEDTDLARNRVGLRNLVTRFIDQAEYHGMLSVFLTPRPDYRFTFAARESAFDPEGNLVCQETAPRRYTYLLGPNESCRTAAERFALLAAYNFTVREDTPLDQEVAIDPEMLGKIFESLVLQLEQTDSDGETSRHDTGSYYTPRPIVHYLCREGLRAWLEQPPLCAPPSPGGEGRGEGEPSGKDAWPHRLEKLLALDASDGIDPAERATLDTCLTPEEARALLDRLDGFRACDPAVGSGAFLVGLLHELLNLHRLCETRARGKDPAEVDADWFYENKKRIIESVLYGVDLQQRAVEICKLRLWISLMVDYPLELDPDNCALPDFRKALKKIAPLPNLDFKIRRANSLIERIRGHAVNFPQAATDSRDFALSLNKLASAKHRFYEARRKKEKRAAQLDILEATAELAKYEFSAAKLNFGFLPTDKDADRAGELARAEKEMGHIAAQVAAARKKGERQKEDDLERLGRVFNDEANPTFVWQLDFAEIFHRSARNGPRCDSLLADEGADAVIANSQLSGFDLVLANPPYVRQEKFKDLKPLLANAYECYTGVADLYVYFFERGVKLLRDGGVLSFISSNSFMNSGSAKKLRQFLKTKTSIRIVIDFAETKVFTAITEPCILVALKGESSKQAISAVKWDESQKPETVTAVVEQRALPVQQSKLQDDGWQLESPAILRLLEKLRRPCEPLGKIVNGCFYRGIVTGANEAFVVDRATRDRLIAEHKSSREVLQPFVRGRDVRRWRVEPQEQWLIFTRRGIEIRKHPAIHDHLKQFKKQLTPGVPGGRKPGSYEWYEIQDNIAYWKEFETPKIVYQDIARYFGMAWDDTGSYLANTCYFIPRADKWLLGVLLSSSMLFYVQKTLGSNEGGFIRLFSIHVEKFPVPNAEPAERKTLETLVDRILKAKRANPAADVSPLEREIDDRVYRLYALTPEDIKILEDGTSPSPIRPPRANHT